MNRKSNREGHTQKRSSYALRLRNIENCAITGEQVVAHPTNDTPIGKVILWCAYLGTNRPCVSSTNHFHEEDCRMDHY